jgi:hypothetical protein
MNGWAYLAFLAYFAADDTPSQESITALWSLHFSAVAQDE